MNKIIGMTGLAASGKDSIGDILVNNFPTFEKMSFASHLKDVVALMFGWDRKMLAGETPEDRAIREQPDKFWSEKLGYDFTPRKALQIFGTNLLRNNFHQNIWVDCLEMKLSKTDKDIVITDVRFPNEIEMIRKLGGKIWRVERGDVPTWFRKVEAYQALPVTEKLKTPLFDEIPELQSIHESEWKWIGIDNPDVVFLNNRSLKDLEKAVLKVVKDEFPELC